MKPRRTIRAGSNPARGLPPKVARLLSPTPGCQCETCADIRKAFAPYLREAERLHSVRVEP